MDKPGHFCPSEDIPPPHPRYVYRRTSRGPVTTYEIGECDNPRSHPEEWCDRRVCEGFWGDYKKATMTVDAMNAADPR